MVSLRRPPASRLGRWSVWPSTLTIMLSVERSPVGLDSAACRMPGFAALDCFQPTRPCQQTEVFLAVGRASCGRAQRNPLVVSIRRAALRCARFEEQGQAAFDSAPDEVDNG